jgi:ABC-2 type transport system permease protein
MGQTPLLVWHRVDRVGVWFLHSSCHFSLVVGLVVALGLALATWGVVGSGTFGLVALVQAEAKRMGQIYRFYNLFTDVPGLQGTVKRRKYLDGIAHTVFKKQKNTWAWLLIRSFLRRTEFLGLYLRLVVIGALCLVFVQQWWLALSVVSIVCLLDRLSIVADVSSP